MKQISKCRIYDAYGSLFYKTNKSYSINVPGGLMDIEGVCLAKIGAMIANYIHTIP